MLLQNVALSLSILYSIFDFLSNSTSSSFSESNTQTLSSGRIMSTKYKARNPLIESWQNMVNCLLKETLSNASVGFGNCLHGVMMRVVLKAFLWYLFHDLSTLIFSFWEILMHICYCLLLIGNKLNIHI